MEQSEKKQGNGPNFMKRLIGHKVAIEFLEGCDCAFVGVFRAYNRYEILVEMENEDTKETVTIIVMKHSISTIAPLDGDPLKKEERNDVAPKLD